MNQNQKIIKKYVKQVHCINLKDKEVLIMALKELTHTDQEDVLELSNTCKHLGIENVLIMPEDMLTSVAKLNIEQLGNYINELQKLHTSLLIKDEKPKSLVNNILKFPLKKDVGDNND